VCHSTKVKKTNGRIVGQAREKVRVRFLHAVVNGDESVFAVRRSVADGTPQGRVGMDNGPNYSMAGGFGCCLFHIPSQNLINAFQIDETTGLPQFDTFNDIRRRAADSAGRLQDANGDPVSNYNIATYQLGVNITWNQETAREALRWERRMELAMGGQALLRSRAVGHCCRNAQRLLQRGADSSRVRTVHGESG